MAKSQITADAIDKVFAEVDPMAAVCGLLGGIAASNGIVPPLTRLLMMFGGAFGSSDGLKGDLQTASQNAAIGAAFNPIAVSPAIWTYIGSLFAGQSEAKDQTTKDALSAKMGLFASGALEGILMYELMQHPELLQTIIKQPAEMLKGLGEIVPG